MAWGLLWHDADLDRLPPLNVDDQLRDHRQVGDAAIDLHVTKCNAVGRVVVPVQLNRERRLLRVVHIADHALLPEVRQEGIHRAEGIVARLRALQLADVQAQATVQGVGDVVGHAGVVILVDDRVGRAVLTDAHAEAVAGRNRVSDHVDARLGERLQLGLRVGQVLGALLRADDAVQRLVQAGVLRRQTGQAASHEALRRDQTYLVVHRVLEIHPVAEQQLHRVGVDACRGLDARGVADGVVHRPGGDHVDALGQTERHLRRPSGAVVAVHQHRHAGGGAAQRVHALARRGIDAQQGRACDGGHTPSVPPASV